MVVDVVLLIAIALTAVIATVIAWCLLGACFPKPPPAMLCPLHGYNTMVGASPPVVQAPTAPQKLDVTKFWKTDTGGKIHMGHCGDLSESKSRIEFCRKCTKDIKGVAIRIV